MTYGNSVFLEAAHLELNFFFSKFSYETLKKTFLLLKVKDAYSELYNHKTKLIRDIFIQLSVLK